VPPPRGSRETAPPAPAVAHGKSLPSTTPVADHNHSRKFGQSSSAWPPYLPNRFAAQAPRRPWGRGLQLGRCAAIKTKRRREAVSHLSRRRAFGTPRADLRRTQDSGGSGEGPISKSRRAANDGSSRSARVCSGRSVVSVSHLVVALSEESHSFHDSGLPIRVFHADPQSASKQIFETKPDHAAYVRRGNGEDGIGGENEEANTHVGPNAQVLQPPARCAGARRLLRQAAGYPTRHASAICSSPPCPQARRTGGDRWLYEYLSGSGDRGPASAD
jgi:hypothetical protein